MGAQLSCLLTSSGAVAALSDGVHGGGDGAGCSWTGLVLVVDGGDLMVRSSTLLEAFSWDAMLPQVVSDLQRALDVCKCLR